MKKLYAFFLLLTMLLCTGNVASAFTFNLQWETAGSIGISYGGSSYYANPQDVSTVTEWGVTAGDYSNIWISVSPGAGYKLVKAVNTATSDEVLPNSDGLIVFSDLTNEKNGFNSFNQRYADQTFNIIVEKVAQSEQYNVNVVNGLDYIQATHANGAIVSLEKGEHSYSFNSSVDGALTITPQGIPTLYSVTLDGTTIKQQSNKSYNVPIANGSNLVIQAFENPASDAPETCKLKFEYGTDMEGCIYTIRDWTANTFVQDNIVDNILAIQGYTDLQLNFVENDYTVKAVYLNGENITSELITSSFDKSQKLRFIVPNLDAATIRIEGTAKVWGTVNFTGYISGAEGVDFSNTYGGSAITMPEGQSFSNSFSVGAYTLNSDNAQKYVFAISEKNPKMFFRPKAGYYIAEFYVSATNSPKEQNSGAASIIKDIDGTFFFMVVKELGTPYTFNITTTGSTWYGKLTSADQSIISNWDNPEGLKLNLSEGTKAVSFYPGYSIPAMVSVSGDDSKTPSAYLDGAPLTGTLNADSNATEFTFTPYYPTEGDGIAEGTKSDIQVYLSTAGPTMSGASLQLEEGATAQFFYSPVRHIADPAGQSVISGTQMIVKPSDPSMIVTYKNEQVTLNENGEFIFQATGNARNNVVTVAPAPEVKYSDMLVEPADGATVKTLSSIKITLPCIDPDFASMLDINEAVLPRLTVKKGNEVVAQYGELGDPDADEDGNTIVPIMLSASITEAGTYTIEIPEGAFVEKTWSEADDAMVNVKGGFITPAYTGTVTVDPDMISICDDYILDPVSGSKVEEISVVKVSFNKISAEEYFSGWEFPNATFTNGTKTVSAIVNYDWMSESENRVMTVTPIDESEEFVPITEPGTWTMTIAAGTFTYYGETNAEIKAEYTIEAAALPYTITPEPGTVVEDLSQITIDFGSVSSVEYNDVAITIAGPQYNGASTDVNGTGSTRIVHFTNPTVEGDYTVTFPAGAFTLDGEASKEVIATYTFHKSYLLTPESGSTLESFEVVISFPHATSVELSDNAEMTLTNHNSYAVPRLSCVKDATASIPTFVLTIPEGAQKPAVGTYDMMIEEGAFIIDGKPSVGITAEYTIDHEVSADYIIDPDGNVVPYDWGVSVAFIFNEDATVTVPAKSAVTITIDGVTVPASSYEIGAEMNMLMIMIWDTKYIKEGVLRVNIAEGAFKVGKDASPAVEGVWNIVAPKTFVAKITPEENDASNKIDVISTIYINFPEATKGEVFNPYGARMYNSSYSYSHTGEITLVDNASTMATDDETSAEGVTFAVTFPATTKAGNYYLTVMDGTFTLDGVHASPLIEATYVVDPSASGVEEIFADENGNVTVYTIEGRIVLDNAPAAAIRDLHKGLYIINGKKVILK